MGYYAAVQQHIVQSKNEDLKSMNLTSSQEFMNLTPSQESKDLEESRNHLTINPSVDPPESLWIFGYGSLMWKPGFRYNRMLRANAQGYRRSFAQGNVTYRGTPTQPGRVATLHPCASTAVPGLVFEVVGREQVYSALEHLYNREVCNGYNFVELDVLLYDNCQSTSIRSITCIASSSNPCYLGEEPDLNRLSSQIARAHGTAGPNADYVLNLAQSIRTLYGDVDETLFSIEKLLLEHNVREEI